MGNSAGACRYYGRLRVAQGDVEKSGPPTSGSQASGRKREATATNKQVLTIESQLDGYTENRANTGGNSGQA